MHTGQLGGNIGPFRDPASGRDVSGTVQGTFTFLAQGDPASVEPQLRSALTNALTQVIGQKLAQNQVAIPTVQMSLPHFMGEVIAASGAHQFGAQIQQVNANVAIQNPTAVQPYQGALPPDPMTAAANAYKQAAAERLDPRNYDYEARVNIGGFKIKASTDGGLDTDGLKNQVKEKAKTEIIWYGIGCVIIGIVGVGLLGLAGYVYSVYQSSTPGAGPSTASAKSTAWDGKSPFSCGGSDAVKIENVTAKLDSGTAITAMGNCRVELNNVNITAPTGIEALANGSVTMKGGSVNGTQFAAKALGNGQITFQGTSVTGKKQALGAAKINGP